jgi:predicted protein tyrosine phosphatase
MSESREKILFVCALNQCRSVAAENLFADSLQYEAKSAGISAMAKSVLTGTQIDWADAIFVMEQHQKNYIINNYGDTLAETKLISLDILMDDIGQFKGDLNGLLIERIGAHLNVDP